jgi:hypothetical protein
MQMEQQLGSPEAVLRVLTTAVCAAGSKSCTHVYVMLERHSHLLQQHIQALGDEQGAAVLLEVLGKMYGQMPTRLHIALSRWVSGRGLCLGGLQHRWSGWYALRARKALAGWRLMRLVGGWEHTLLLRSVIWCHSHTQHRLLCRDTGMNTQPTRAL